MTIMKIEVFPDTSKPSGGHAIIRLKGIALLPPGAKFRIDPIDDSLDDGDIEGWPHGELSPLDTRQTPEGIELRIGPNVVDAPMLEPGTPVTISVPNSQLTAELIWPDLPLSSNAAAAPVVMSPSQMAAEMAANERAKIEAIQAEKAAEAERAARAAKAVRDAQATKDARIAEEAAAKVVADQLERDKAKSLVPPIPTVVLDDTPQPERFAAATRELEAALALEPLEPGSEPAVARPKPTSLSDTLQQQVPPQGNKPASPPGQPDRPRSQTATLSSLKPAIDRPEAPNAMLPERDISLPTIVLKRSSEAASGANPSSLETTRLRRESIDGHVEPPTKGSRLMPFLAGAGAAGIALAAFLAVTAMRPGPGQSGVSAGIVGGELVHRTALADAFTVGTQSPRGEIATDVDLPTALRLADYNLHGVDRPIDRAEAEFWLKKAMSLTASHSQIRWAMTQLGTLSAEPVSGTPDYEKARLLWEISAANGDPVAMCFLGTLMEHGLGLAADRSKALEQFKRARAAGGCPNSDEAITRLSK